MIFELNAKTRVEIPARLNFSIEAYCAKNLKVYWLDFRKNK